MGLSIWIYSSSPCCLYSWIGGLVMTNLLKEKVDEVVELYFDNYDLKEVIKQIKEN